MRSQTTRTIAGRVSSTGAPVTGRDYTARRAATGKFVIDLPGDFRLTGFSAMLANNAANGWVLSYAHTANSVSLDIYNSGAVAADFPFSFVAVGA